MEIQKENKVIKASIIIFWTLFWFLNVVDKLIGGSTFLWVGKDRMAQFVKYFSSIGVENVIFPQITLYFVTLLEFIAFVYLALALVKFFKGDNEATHHLLFWGMLWSFVIMSFFAIGDQIFGDRVELLEHSLYWIAILLSWFVYTHLRKEMD